MNERWSKTLDLDIIHKVLHTVLSRGGEYADIYYEEKDTGVMVLEDGKLDKVLNGSEWGIGIRLIKEYKTAYVYTNDCSEENLLQMAKLLSSQGNTLSVPPLCSREWRHLEAGNGFHYRILPSQFLEQKADYLLEIDALTKEAFPLVKQAAFSLNDSERRVITVNSLGEVTEQKSVHVRAAANIIVAENGEVQSAAEVLSGVSGWEILKELNFTKKVFTAAKRASDMLSARLAPAGKMMVVLSGEAGGTMVHEACGHGLEADHIQKQSSVYAGKWGEKVAASFVTVVDDATLPNEFGSYEFDDEGTPGIRKTLIEDGILVGHMYDRLTAMKNGVRSTGNGRRQSYKHKPMPRMSNTFIMPHNGDEEDNIIKDTGQGLYVRKIGGGQVNPVTGDFVFHVQEAYRIENGVVTYPVRGATLIGNGPEVLRQIDRISDDLRFASGLCGKAGQSVPVGHAQPALRIRELIVGGR